MTAYQTIMKRRDREIYTQGLYGFTQSQSYIQSTVKPLSISLCNQSQIIQTPHPLCTQHTPQARITLTLHDFTTTFTECNLNNFKKLRKG